MSTIDTSTWSPDSSLNTDIGGIPLNSDASIAQTWQAIQMLMAALKGDTSDIKLTINQPDGTTIVATNQTLTVVDNGHAHTIANVAGLQDALNGKQASGSYATASHTHGNISNAGAIGSVSGLPVVTGADGIMQAGAFGTAAGTICEGNDSRLSDARTPTSHTHGNISNDGKLSTASRAVVTDGDNKIAVSSVTATELGFLSGVTSAVQTQLDAKAADSGVVHLAGTEAVSGAKTFSSTIKTSAIDVIAKTTDSSVAIFCGGSSSAYAKGAKTALYGAGSSTLGGSFLCATGGTAQVQLIGSPAGTLQWGGQPLQTASDERIKTPLEAVPDEVLDAWEGVQWGQFQYMDAVAEKGESARLHLGLIAQRVKTVFEARGLDACAYGILCHEVRQATEEEEAVDLWMVRYTEALAMEAACQRRRADRLEARIKMLEEKLQ